MEQLLITDAILACPLTASEQKLLAYLCQQAAANGGQCTDSNSELALALGIHIQTISRLINQLGERKLLQTSVAKDRANQRTLTPSNRLLADYNRHVYSPPGASKAYVYSTPPENDPDVYSTDGDYNHNVYSASRPEEHPLVDPPRQCVITGMDISQQPAGENFANRQTIQQLRLREPAVFEQLTAELLPFDDLALLLSEAGDLRLSSRLRRLAKQRGVQSEHALTPQRLCPLSGADITHQGRHYPFVEEETLRTLLKLDRPAFVQILARLGLADQPEQDPTTQWQRALERVQQLTQTYRPAEPIPSVDEVSSAPKAKRRYCLLTGIDITHQQLRHQFATAWTIEALYKSNRSGFDRVAMKFLPDSLRQGSAAAQCFALSGRIRELAKAYR